jgi:excisionase family DNA binding protein
MTLQRPLRPAAPAETTKKSLPDLLTVPEVAAFLRTSPESIYAMVERGQLAGVVRLGRRILFNADVLRAWISEKTTTASSTPAGAPLRMRTRGA